MRPAAAGALGGGFWRLLSGLIFFVPLLGLAVARPPARYSVRCADGGISDDFIREVRERLRPDRKRAPVAGRIREPLLADPRCAGGALMRIGLRIDHPDVPPCPLRR